MNFCSLFSQRHAERHALVVNKSYEGKGSPHAETVLASTECVHKFGLIISQKSSTWQSPSNTLRLGEPTRHIIRRNTVCWTERRVKEGKVWTLTFTHKKIDCSLAARLVSNNRNKAQCQSNTAKVPAFTTQRHSKLVLVDVCYRDGVARLTKSELET